MKEFIAKHKITGALIGGSLVLGSAYGSCILAPGEPVAVEVAVEAEAPAVVAPAEAEAPPAE